MIKTGIKIKPDNWVECLLDSQATCCEVWFLINKANNYADMFQFLKRKQIRTGLHFRGVIEDNMLANPADPDKAIRSNSILLMEKCIEIASRNGFSYVNIHPGYAQLWKFDAEKQIFMIADNSKHRYQDSKYAFRESAVLLHEYGQKNNVNVLWESPSFRAPADLNKETMDHSCLRSTDALNSFILERIAKKDGILVTNNITNIMSELQSASKSEIVNYLFDRTEKLAPYTKLLHINTLLRPYNDIHNHYGITDAGFNNEEMPTKDQLRQLLELFNGRNDIWAINESRHKHVQNYKALRELLVDVKKNNFSSDYAMK